MNSVEIEGFTSFSKVHNFQGGAFSHRFSITLQAGKDKTGQYRKEYIDVRLSGDCSAQIQYPGDGSRIKCKGRLRCEPWTDRNQQKRKAIYLEAFEAQVIQAPNPQFQGQVPQQVPNTATPRPQFQPPQAPQQGYQPQPPQGQAPAPQRPVHNNPNQYRANPSAPPASNNQYKPQAPQAPEAPQPIPTQAPNVGQWDEGIPF
jgi:single-stranded DNA-binding protein